MASMASTAAAEGASTPGRSLMCRRHAPALHAALPGAWLQPPVHPCVRPVLRWQAQATHVPALCVLQRQARGSTPLAAGC